MSTLPLIAVQLRISVGRTEQSEFRQFGVARTRVARSGLQLTNRCIFVRRTILSFPTKSGRTESGGTVIMTVWLYEPI